MGEANTTGSGAVVTGSSRGIGRAIAEELARRGHAVCINYTSEKSQDEAEAFAEELARSRGVDSYARKANVADAGEATSLIEEACERFCGLGILVNNAGITRDNLIIRMKEEDFDQVIDVNLKGAFNCCKAAAPLMMKQHYGRIINMSSVSGIKGNFGQTNYAASKAGLIGLSKSLARELATRNITVNVIAPGFIETDMTESLSEKIQEKIREEIACKRFGAPKEVAALAGFLASEDAAYITGQVISIDGGMAI